MFVYDMHDFIENSLLTEVIRAIDSIQAGLNC